MLGGAASMVIASMASLSTATLLFCVLNLVIATIFIASNFKSPHHHRQNQLARSPSLLERVKSVNLASFYTTPDSHGDQVQSETSGYNSTSPLRRAPSLLERVKSFDFSLSSFHATPSDQSHPHDRDYQSQPESEQTHYDLPSQLARAPSLLERVKSINFSSYTQNQNPFPTESEQLNNSTGELARAPSLLDRVKSFKVPSPFNSHHQSGETFSSQHQHTDPDPHHDPVQDHNVTSGKSKNSGMTPAETSSSNIKKSPSEKRVPASDDGEEDVDWRGEKDESIDAKADDFIKRFKQQLKLQRLDSLQRFKEMFHGGTSSA